MLKAGFASVWLKYMIEMACGDVVAWPMATVWISSSPPSSLGSNGVPPESARTSLALSGVPRESARPATWTGGARAARSLPALTGLVGCQNDATHALRKTWRGRRVRTLSNPPAPPSLSPPGGFQNIPRCESLLCLKTARICAWCSSTSSESWRRRRVWGGAFSSHGRCCHLAPLSTERAQRYIVNIRS